MRRALPLLLLIPIIGCSHGSPKNLERPSAQQDFGVEMARMNLWREAEFRFKRAVDLNPNDAMAHNNLAVSMEANGDFDNALKEYREALRLDRGNSYIQKNYSRFTEFMSRNKKRQQKGNTPPPKTASATDEKPKPIAVPPDKAAPPMPGPVIPGTEALPPGLVTPPPGPLPGGNPPERHPPTGVLS